MTVFQQTTSWGNSMTPSEKRYPEGSGHPLYPVGSNGASQAIIDARVLARELALRPSIEEAIAAYDAQRRPQTAGVVLANRQGGPERRQSLLSWTAPTGQDPRAARTRMQ